MVAERMPLDARAWIDTARSLGVSLTFGRGGYYDEGIGRIPSDQLLFLAWWRNRIGADVIGKALEAESVIGPNDRRLMELERRWYALERQKERETARLGDNVVDRRDQILTLQDVILQRMVDTPADTIRGAEARAAICRVEAELMFYDNNGNCHADVFERGMIATLYDVQRLAGEG
ncbi:hypothetical protein DRB17_13310 [Ferruginivarius sediminum]|uniref:Uncharacterized protein n=2 Tax=Ferruginivarius sediminum TaxID=2661937 RepID=A0A369TB94_9PROT|nr:hypothetical protein DRB17_13310 [Ferruginivarius sediminum]